MSVKLKRVLCLFISLIIIFGALSAASIICNHPSEDVENTVDSFYRENENGLDVVMVGSSAASKDFQPSILWNAGNITSYCFAVGACSANIYTSIIDEVLTKQPDAVILIDIDGIVVDDKFQAEEGPIKLWIDSMPKNRNHLNMIKKYFSDEPGELLFPILKYHRYMTSLYAYVQISSRLLKKEILDIKDPLGGSTLNNCKPIKNAVQYYNTETGTEKMTELSQQVFEELLEYCRDRSIKNMLFVNLPKSSVEDWQLERNINYSRRTNYIRKTVAQYGYEVYDYNALGNPAGLDETADFADTLHLTTRGAIKFSEYFAGYLNDKYGFSEKNDETALEWNSRYEQAKELMTY